MTMKKCLQYHWNVLLGHKYILLAVLLAAAVLGISAGSDVRAYAMCGQGLDATSALALALEGRRAVGFVGAVWTYLFLYCEFQQRGINNTVYRGCGKLSIFVGKYLLLLFSCVICSLVMQGASLLTACEWINGVPAAWLLRCMGLRLLLDLGTMTAPLLVVMLLQGNMTAGVLCLVYGLVLYFKAPVSYGLWLPQTAEAVSLSVLWPIVALPVSAILSFAVWSKAELR